MGSVSTANIPRFHSSNKRLNSSMPAWSWGGQLVSEYSEHLNYFTAWTQDLEYHGIYVHGEKIPEKTEDWYMHVVHGE